MRIFLTGVTGYIGKRLLPVLLDQGHIVICCVRDRSRFVMPPDRTDQIEIFEWDFTESVDTDQAPRQIDVAFYLIHALSSSIDDFSKEEMATATHFKEYMQKTTCKQVIYLGGIANEENLSSHLASRKGVEDVLREGAYATTILRAAIIVGSGSASFEIIRDLVEKLPVMVTPRWLNTRCQPIAVKNVIEYLNGIMLNPETYYQTFDIGGPDILTYKEMMLKFANVRNLKRYILTLPVLTPRLSSYWLYFVTATSYKLAVNLVNSMKVEVVCKDHRLQDLLNLDLIKYEDAVRAAFNSIEQDMVVSSWIDAYTSSGYDKKVMERVQVPVHGCFIDRRERILQPDNKQRVLDNIWAIGGRRGWYYGNWLWRFRGFLDKMIGGVGLRRGRTRDHEIHPGDALDFWRVLVADQSASRLVLYAEVKLPGEAWLEFTIDEIPNNARLIQTATFRPKGLWGRLYWYGLLPLHHIIFKGMINNLVRPVTKDA